MSELLHYQYVDRIHLTYHDETVEVIATPCHCNKRITITQSYPLEIFKNTATFDPANGLLTIAPYGGIQGFISKNHNFEQDDKGMRMKQFRGISITDLPAHSFIISEYAKEFSVNEIEDVVGKITNSGLFQKFTQASSVSMALYIFDAILKELHLPKRRFNANKVKRQVFSPSLNHSHLR